MTHPTRSQKNANPVYVVVTDEGVLVSGSASSRRNDRDLREVLEDAREQFPDIRFRIAKLIEAQP